MRRLVRDAWRKCWAAGNELDRLQLRRESGEPRAAYSKAKLARTTARMTT